MYVHINAAKIIYKKTYMYNFVKLNVINCKLLFYETN